VYAFSRHSIFFNKVKLALDQFAENSAARGGLLLKSSTRNRVFSIQKTFLFFKRQSILNLSAFYKFKHLKRRHLFNFFKNFRKYNFLQVYNFFSNNCVKLLGRVFSFFNFFFLRLMLKKGLILINFKKASSLFYALKVGDFVSFLFIKRIFELIAAQVLVQRKHLYRVKKKMFKIARARSVIMLKTQPKYYSKNFVQLSFFLKKIPS